MKTNLKMKQIMTEELVKKWIKENKELLEDYRELCEKLLIFRASWGIEIGFIFKNSEETKGRNLKCNAVEELFDAQLETNARIKNK